MNVIIKDMKLPPNGEYEARLTVYNEGDPSLSVTVDNVTTTYDLVPDSKRNSVVRNAVYF